MMPEGDDHLLDLGRAFVNAERADLAIETLDNVAGNEPKTAEHLDGGVDAVFAP